MSEILNNEILKETSIVFTGIEYTSADEDDLKNYKLYLLKCWGTYIVYSPTKYIRDDSYMTLNDGDIITYPIALSIHKIFDNLEEAESFYTLIISKLPKVIDIKSIIKEDFQCNGCLGGKSIHYDNFGNKLKHEEVFEKELLRHGYQRVIIRMFRFNTSIVINKNLRLRFESEDSCRIAFDNLKKYLGQFEFYELKYDGKDDKLDKLLNKLLNLSLGTTSYSSIEIKKDNYKRIIKLNLNFNHNNMYVDFKFNLAERNAYYHGYKVHSEIFYRNSESVFKIYKDTDILCSAIESLLERLTITNS